MVTIKIKKHSNNEIKNKKEARIGTYTPGAEGKGRLVGIEPP
jgi:hypothetical protein